MLAVCYPSPVNGWDVNTDTWVIYPPAAPYFFVLTTAYLARLLFQFSCLDLLSSMRNHFWNVSSATRQTQICPSMAVPACNRSVLSGASYAVLPPPPLSLLTLSLIPTRLIIQLTRCLV